MPPEFDRTPRESVGLLLKVHNERDPGVTEVLNRVGHLCKATAELFGQSPYEVERVELAGRLHDVGKLAITDAILDKPGRLDAAEWVIMRTHAEIGERIILSSPSIEHVGSLVRSHHERPDGTGYPDRLGGQDIPFGACVVSVCAAFVAMMRNRPFSDAITVEEALDELNRCAGSQFDTRIVEGFSTLIRKATA